MIAVLDYGIGNLRSAQKALEHVGAKARLAHDARDVEGASGVVLPGVVSFGACAGAMRAQGFDVAAAEAIGAGVPFLGICVGMQVLFSSSEEDPGVAGLGVLPGSVHRLEGTPTLPQMQWNRLQRAPGPPCRLLDGLVPSPWMYFVHSYSARPATDVPGAARTVATCEFGREVVAMVERDNLWGVQFHPEKSGRNGLALLANFVDVCEGRGRPPSGG